MGPDGPLIDEPRDSKDVVLERAWGAGAAVAAVAVRAGFGVAAPIWVRASESQRPHVLAYALAGAVAAAVAGKWLVLVLLACGAIELGRRRLLRRGRGPERVVAAGRVDAGSRHSRERAQEIPAALATARRER
jgi:hypothetical protein